MRLNMDKRDRAEIFRKRLLEAMARKDISRSALARDTFVDRSTIGQLLKDDLPRLGGASGLEPIDERENAV